MQGTRIPVRRVPGEYEAHRLDFSRRQLKVAGHSCAALPRTRHGKCLSNVVPRLAICVERTAAADRHFVDHGQHVTYLSAVTCVRTDDVQAVKCSVQFFVDYTFLGAG